MKNVFTYFIFSRNDFQCSGFKIDTPQYVAFVKQGIAGLVRKENQSTVKKPHGLYYLNSIDSNAFSCSLLYWSKSRLDVGNSGHVKWLITEITALTSSTALEAQQSTFRLNLELEDLAIKIWKRDDWKRPIYEMFTNLTRKEYLEHVISVCCHYITIGNYEVIFRTQIIDAKINQWNGK